MKRLLFISHRAPYPPDKGERVRAFHEIVSLSEAFEVTVAFVDDGPDAAAQVEGLSPWCRPLLAPAGRCRLLRGGLSFLAGRGVTHGYFASNRLRQMILAEHARQPFDVVVGYSSAMLPHVLAVIGAAHVMDLVDADSAKWGSYAAASRWPTSWLYRREQRAVAALERRAVAACDVTLVVTAAEAAALGPDAGRTRVVGNGVDTDYFDPQAVESADLGPSPVVFVGSMDYRPNIDAACWFAENVWPTVRGQVGDATFTIVGRDPSPAVQRLAQLPGVTVTGVVDDVRPYLAAAGAVVAPLRIARGIQNKVLEAMAMARPVVGSSPAMEGLDVDAGLNVHCADNVEQWSQSVLGLLSDRAAGDAMGRAAREHVGQGYTWRRRLQPLVDLCGELAEVSAVREGVA